ncbi:MAG: hypothetical protein AAGC93_29045 [Cyanobacteria bacterium P01_F01_bin.53]
MPISNETTASTKFKYKFTRFYHPHTCLFLKQLFQQGIDGLLNPDPTLDEISRELYRQLMPSETFGFRATYRPTERVHTPYPKEAIGFNHDSPYGSYNWELFFHIPLRIATSLLENQRFAEARQWFHYIFDPTHANSNESAPACFWKIKPFYEAQLASPSDTLQDLTELLTEENIEFEQQVQAWEADPFQPHAIARLRIEAYMKYTVMQYLDCLMGEADLLFRQYSRESLNEAKQLYVLAAKILGDKPVQLAPQETADYTANLLLGRLNLKGIKPLEKLTSQVSSKLDGVRAIGGSRAADRNRISGQGGNTNYSTLLLFCIPHNEKLYGYWETIEDRLFKLRHCMTIDGQVQELPLFAPPIDPGLLARASAAGLDIGSIISSLSAPRPHYRFSYVLQKAMQFCSEVRSLGGALLSALEKQDAEELGILRNNHEIKIFKAIRTLKEKNIAEAETALEGLHRSKEITQERAEYYRSREYVNKREQKSLDKQESSRSNETQSEKNEKRAAVSHVIPNLSTTLKIPPSLSTSFGGSNIGAADQAYANKHRRKSAYHSYGANKASIMGGYDRRRDDWEFQVKQAEKELEQIDQQILAAEIRLQIAEKDLENQELQISQAEEIEAFLREKFTDKELYSWMVSQLSGLYFQSYQMAYDLAKQAEKCIGYELPLATGQSFIEFGYWDSRNKGLLAGERLYHDLQRLEIGYLESNIREYELTEHISLKMLDPGAVLELIETGFCEFDLPEALFDIRTPGHYLRRIKSVSLTIPSVTGPYASINCTLTLAASKFRHSSTVLGSYSDAVNYTDNFSDVGSQSIVTSSAQNDSGLFEPNLRDERYLPFEGAGVISSWTLELPQDFPAFDYGTISDVILHLRYTARDGGVALKGDEQKAALNDWLASQLSVFSARHEFPSEWHQFLYPEQASNGHSLQIDLSKERFPFQFNNQTIEITQIDLYLQLKANESNTLTSVNLTTPDGRFKVDQRFNGQNPTDDQNPIALPLASISLDSSHRIHTSEVWTIEVNNGTLDAVEDIVILCQYRVSIPES